MEGTTVSVSSILGQVTTFVSNVIEWVGDYATVITEQPILMVMCIAVPLVGLGVGLLNRLIRVN